jgi:Fe-S-cluster-containing hydrogenase component 2
MSKENSANKLPYPEDVKHMKRILVDQTYCTGCRYCEIVCSLSHEGEVNYRKSRIRVFGDALNGIDQPVVCDPKKCETMPCISSCPVSAIKINEKLDYPTLDLETCTGCRTCVNVCPINAIFFDEDKSKALKCDLCGGETECVKRCTAHVYLPHITTPVLRYE